LQISDIDCGFQIVDFRLQIADFRFEIVDFILDFRFEVDISDLKLQNCAQSTNYNLQSKI
jgi:hypothetical protein